MSSKQNHIVEILKIFDKLSASLMSLIAKLAKQKILSLEVVINKLPTNHKNKIIENFKIKKVKNIYRGK